MSLCVKTLYYVFPEIKAFGCCHEVFGTQKVLKGILEETMGLKDVKREDIQVNVLGINHFTWFDYASYKGIDLFPIYRKYTEEHKEDGYKEADKNWANSTFECAHIVKFDLFRKYGLIAAAGDRHLVEFMPGVGDSYLKDPETVKRWKFGLTTVDWRKKDLQERLAKSARLAAGEEEIELKPTGEECFHHQIKITQNSCFQNPLMVCHMGIHQLLDLLRKLSGIQRTDGISLEYRIGLYNRTFRQIGNLMSGIGNIDIADLAGQSTESFDQLDAFLSGGL